jgi:hypothetical protein
MICSLRPEGKANHEISVMQEKRPWGLSRTTFRTSSYLNNPRPRAACPGEYKVIIGISFR